MSICNINMLDEIFLLGGAALGAHTAAVLETVLTQRSALDVSGMRNGNHNILIGIKILWIEFIGRRNYLGPAGVSKLVLKLLCFLLDKGVLQTLVGKEGRQFFYKSNHGIIVCT